MNAMYGIERLHESRFQRLAMQNPSQPGALPQAKVEAAPLAPDVRMIPRRRND